MKISEFLSQYRTFLGAVQATYKNLRKEEGLIPAATFRRHMEELLQQAPEVDKLACGTPSDQAIEEVFMVSDEHVGNPTQEQLPQQVVEELQKVLANWSHQIISLNGSVGSDARRQRVLVACYEQVTHALAASLSKPGEPLPQQVVSGLQKVLDGWAEWIQRHSQCGGDLTGARRETLQNCHLVITQELNKLASYQPLGWTKTAPTVAGTYLCCVVDKERNVSATYCRRVAFGRWQDRENPAELYADNRPVKEIGNFWYGPVPELPTSV